MIDSACTIWVFLKFLELVLVLCMVGGAAGLV
jgi:hypothetical protein